MTTLADDKLLNLEPAAAEALAAALGEPDWALQVRRTGLASWEALPYPKNTDEEWRRTDPERFRPEGRRIVTVAPTFETPADGPGPIRMPLAEALQQDPEARGRLFGAEHHTQEKFSALNAAYRSGGAWVRIPHDQSIQAPLRATHHVPATPAGPSAFFPHSVVVAGRNSRATVVEYFDSEAGDLMAAPVLEAHLEEGAQLQYVVVYRWGEGARAMTRFHARLEKDAHLRVLFLGVGGAMTKNFMTGDLVGTGAKSEMLGLVFAAGRQHFDVDTLHNHLVANTASDVLFNCALNDRSRTIFTGNIFVAPQAQKTDAYQKSRNLLLSDKARADAMPKLEILANDVRCTHGATFTTYDRDQQFYLQSRGLKDADARRLIITGFFQEVIERLEGPELVDWLAGLMQEKMEASLGS